MGIRTYEAERGLEQQIEANASIRSFHKIVKTPISVASALHTEQRIDPCEAIASIDDYDLYGLQSVMVSSGWNKNRDIWLREELWEARSTAVHKPFNLEHNPYRIIGHITGDTIVDDDMKIVASLDELPEIMHILANAVIYRNRGNRFPELTAESEQMIEEIEAGDWSVSVEALMKNFDYGIRYPSGEEAIVARNEETAFMTKKLAIYGGNGEYNGGELGRVLRNFTISGKGLVKQPANPDSCILSTMAYSFTSARLATVEASHQNNINEGDIQMSEQVIAELNKTKDSQAKRIEELLASLEQVKAEADKKALAEKEAMIAEAAKRLADVEAAKSEVETKCEAATASVTKLTEEKEAISTKLDESVKQVEEFKAEASKRAEEAATASRISDLVDAGVDKEAAASVFEQYKAVDDTAWAGIVEMQKAIHAQASTEEEAAGEKGEAVAIATSVEDIEPNVEASMNEDVETKPDADVSIIACISDMLKAKE